MNERKTYCSLDLFPFKSKKKSCLCKITKWVSCLHCAKLTNSHELTHVQYIYSLYLTVFLPQWSHRWLISCLQKVWFMSTQFIVINVQKPIMLNYIKLLVYHSIVLNHSRCDSSWLLLSWLLIALTTPSGTSNIVLQLNLSGTHKQLLQSAFLHCSIS